MWYDFLNEQDEDEPDGDDFLSQEAAPVKELRKSVAARSINNVLCHFGGQKPRRGTTEYMDMKFKECTNLLHLAAVLTGNTVESVALPIDVKKIREYKLEDRRYELPAYNADDSATYIPILLGICEKAYLSWLDEDEKKFNEKKTNNGYMTRTSFATLKPTIAQMMRYCMKYWHLNPWLGRDKAYKQSLVVLRANWKNKGTPTKSVIDNLLKERTLALMLHKIKTLPRTKASSDATKEMFSNNEDAQAWLKKVTAALKVKCPHKTFDYLEDLQYYVSTLKETEEKEKFNFLANLVINETEAYKERVREHTAKVDKARTKEEELENKKKAQVEKTRLLLLENRKVEEADKKVKEFLAAQASAGTSKGSGGGNSGEETNDTTKPGDGVPPNPDNMAGTTTETPTEDGTMEDLPDVATDPMAIFKLEYGRETIVDQRPCGSKRKASLAAQEDAEAPIVKSITDLIGTKVAVTFTRPGTFWVNAIAFRLGHVGTTMFLLYANHKTLVQGCIKITAKKQPRLERVLLAVMLHEAVKKKTKDKWWEEVGVVDYFYEPNFRHDVKATDSLWSSTVIQSMYGVLRGFYTLWCCPEEHDGKSQRERKDLFLEFLDDSTCIAKEPAKMIREICVILSNITAELRAMEEGVARETKKIAIDPFRTSTPKFE